MRARTATRFSSFFPDINYVGRPRGLANYIITENKPLHV